MQVHIHLQMVQQTVLCDLLAAIVLPLDSHHAHSVVQELIQAHQHPLGVLTEVQAVMPLLLDQHLVRYDQQECIQAQQVQSIAQNDLQGNTLPQMDQPPD